MQAEDDGNEQYNRRDCILALSEVFVTITIGFLQANNCYNVLLRMFYIQENQIFPFVCAGQIMIGIIRPGQMAE